MAYSYEYQKAWAAKDKDKIKERMRLYYTANKERYREHGRLYVERNKEKVAAAHKAYREANKELVAAGAKISVAKYRARTKQYILEYKLAHPCLDCGETDPIVLDFDHRDPSTKAFNIGGSSAMGFDNMIAEIAKCDIRCANCHRRKTHNDRLAKKEKAARDTAAPIAG